MFLSESNKLWLKKWAGTLTEEETVILDRLLVEGEDETSLNFSSSMVVNDSNWVATDSTNKQSELQKFYSRQLQLKSGNSVKMNLSITAEADGDPEGGHLTSEGVFSLTLLNKEGDDILEFSNSNFPVSVNIEPTYSSSSDPDSKGDGADIEYFDVEESDLNRGKIDLELYDKSFGDKNKVLNFCKQLMKFSLT